MKLGTYQAKQTGNRHFVVLEGQDWQTVSEAFKTNRPSDVAKIIVELARELKETGAATIE